MLRFNAAPTPNIGSVTPYLNTSYVKVQLLKIKLPRQTMLNLNTSYVKVQPILNASSPAFFTAI